MADADETVAKILEAGRVRREAAVEEILAPLTPRERSLVRDAAVMGHVLGSLWERGPRPAIHAEDTYPKDTKVFHDVLYAVSREPGNDGYGVLRGAVHQYSDIGGTVPTLDHPVVRPIWNWIIAANDGCGGDVDDLIGILNALGVPCPADLEG